MNCGTKLIVLLLTLTITTPLHAKKPQSILTLKEEKAGKASVAQFSKIVAEGNKEDKRLYWLLTNNKEFFATWSRSIADKDDMSKLKALIRVCRKEKLWENVEWMLETLSEYEDESPAYYRLKALSRWEQGEKKFATDAAKQGVTQNTWHRGLRRLWYNLKWEQLVPKPQPKIANPREFRYLVDAELCHERTHLLRLWFDSIESKDDIPEAALHTKSSETLVAVYEDYLGDKGKLPLTYNRSHKCQCYVGRDPEDRELSRVVCKRHGYRGVVRKVDGSPLIAGKIYHHKISDDIILEAMAAEDGIYAVKAAENLLLRKERLSPEDELKVVELVKSKKLNEQEMIILMRALLHYVRRFELRPPLERAAAELSNRTKGPVCALTLIILQWCKKETLNFSDAELAALTADGYGRLYTLHDSASDIMNFVYDYLKRDKEKAYARLKKIEKNYLHIDRHWAIWLRSWLDSR